MAKLGRKKSRGLTIQKAEMRSIKKRIGANEYQKHVDPIDEYYMKKLNGELVKDRLPINKIKLAHETLFDLAEWVHDNLKWKQRESWEPEPNDARDVLEKGKGNCNDKVGVLISFLKAIGIPGRYVGSGHSRAEVMLPHSTIEVEFFPSNFVIETKEGHWEIGRRGKGYSYIHFRIPDEHSRFQYAETERVFKRSFKDPLNQMLQKKFCEAYKKQHDIWFWDQQESRP